MVGKFSSLTPQSDLYGRKWVNIFPEVGNGFPGGLFQRRLLTVCAPPATSAKIWYPAKGKQELPWRMWLAKPSAFTVITKQWVGGERSGTERWKVPEYREDVHKAGGSVFSAQHLIPHSPEDRAKVSCLGPPLCLIYISSLIGWTLGPMWTRLEMRWLNFCPLPAPCKLHGPSGAQTELSLPQESRQDPYGLA